MVDIVSTVQAQVPLDPDENSDVLDRLFEEPDNPDQICLPSSDLCQDAQWIETCAEDPLTVERCPNLIRAAQENATSAFEIQTEVDQFYQETSPLTIEESYPSTF